MNHDWDFASVFLHTDALLVGAFGTLRIFVICLFTGLPLGLLVGLARTARTRWIQWPASAFVEFFRNTQVLVQILWFYYALPMLAPFDVSPLMAAALGIALNSAAFSAEIYRGGIQSIEPGQWEGAQALGMTRVETLRRVVLPQAIRRVLPALTNRAIEIFKMSTLASVVAYVELVQQGKLIASIDFNPIEVYTVIALAFFAFLYPLVQMTYALERRLGRGD